MKVKMENKERFKVKSKKIINSFKYAIQGVCASFKTERNMKIHFSIMILIIKKNRNEENKGCGSIRIRR